MCCIVCICSYIHQVQLTKIRWKRHDFDAGPALRHNLYLLLSRTKHRFLFCFLHLTMNNIRETVISPVTSAAMIVSRENVVSRSVSHPPTVYIIYGISKHIQYLIWGGIQHLHPVPLVVSMELGTAHHALRHLLNKISSFRFLHWREEGRREEGRGGEGERGRGGEGERGRGGEGEREGGGGEGGKRR